MSISTADYGLAKRLRELIIACQSPFWITKAARRWLLRRIGIKISRDCMIEAGCLFGSGELTIGDAAFINQNFRTDGYGPVTIGANVFIGPGVLVITGRHEILETPWQRASKSVTYLPTRIETGAWIAARVTLLPGVRVAEGCVIGAGAVVTQSTEPNGLYAGVPAVRKRDL